MRRWMFTVAVLVACAALLWQWQGAAPPPAHPHDPEAQGEGQASNARASDGANAQLDREALQAAAPTASRGAAARLWRVHLEGLAPDVPWSSRLTLVVEDRRHIDVPIDEHGTGTFEPPAIARNPAFQMLRVVANDPNYEVVRNARRMDNLQLHGEDRFEVRPISLLRGRVLRPAGLDGEVRVRAFPMTADGPSEAEVARTGADGQGEYVLRVPPDASMLVVADAVDRSRHRSGPFTGFAPDIAQLFGGRNDVDHRNADATIVPACANAAGTFGSPRRVADLTLTRAARLTGRVTYSDGSGVADLWCTARPVDAVRWRGDLEWTGTRVFAANSGYTDTNGNFSIWLPAGVPFVVTATSSNPLLLAGEPSATASAPGHVLLTAPGDPVAIEVVRDNRPTAAVVTINGSMEIPTDERGRLALTLGAQAVRVQARAPKLASAPRLLPAAARPSTVRLELERESLAAARITVRAERPILQAVFCWQPVAGGRTRRVHASRKSEHEPFAMEVPPGDYRLEVLADPDATPAASPGRYLRFAPTTCTVAASGLTADYEAALGGRLALTVLDRSGTPVRASFRLTDRAGTALAPQTAGRTASGDLQVAPPGEVLPVPRSEVVDVLPTGRYELVVDTGRGREQRRTVTVESCRTAYETIRLP